MTLNVTTNLKLFNIIEHYTDSFLIMLTEGIPTKRLLPYGAFCNKFGAFSIISAGTTQESLLLGDAR